MFISYRFKTAYIRQKSNADNRGRDLEFEEDDWVYLKISPINGVMRSGKNEKLTSILVHMRCSNESKRFPVN